MLAPDDVLAPHKRKRRSDPARFASIGWRLLYMIDSTGPVSRRKPSSGEGAAGSEEARLRQQAIGVKLRHMFDEVVNEPVPDEFLDILRRADEAASKGDQD